MNKSFWWKLALVTSLCGPLQVQAQDPIAALKAGGQVIVLRHTSSPRELPDAALLNPDNTEGERQLDAQGRADAEALGSALRRLGIAIAEVRSSPAYRARETARLAGFADVVVQDELGNESMRDAGAANTAWLQAQAAQAIAGGGNKLLITHGPNISAAFPEQAQEMDEGDALVFDPARPQFVGRIGIGEWSGF